jgi:hypothetical protein
MTPYERLLQEGVPTRPELPPPPGPRPPWTPEQQAEHRADLLEALHGWHWEDDPSLSATRRRLRLVRRGEEDPTTTVDEHHSAA